MQENGDPKPVKKAKQNLAYGNVILQEGKTEPWVIDTMLLEILYQFKILYCKISFQMHSIMYKITKSTKDTYFAQINWIHSCFIYFYGH